VIRLLRDRDFRLLWIGGLVSMMGDWALIAALPFEVFRRTGSTLATAAVLIAGLAPAIVLGSAAGVFVDRWDRRRLMVLVNIGLALALLPLFAIDIVGLWVVYAVLFAMSALEQLFIPAEVALLPQLVGPEHLVSANSLSSLNRNLARLVGPALGGISFALAGLTGAVAVDLVTFAGAAVLIAMIGPGKSFRAERQIESLTENEPTNAAPTGIARLVVEWREGISVMFAEPVLRALAAFALLGAIGEGLLSALFVPWVSEILHGDEAAFAAILSMQAIGGLIGAFVVGRFLNNVAPGILLGVGTLIFAAIDLVIFTYPLVLPIVLPALILMVVVGIPIAALGVGNTTLQQTFTTDSHRGRVVGLFGTIQALGTVSGLIFAGFFGNTIGIIPLMSVDSFLYAAGGVIVLYTVLRGPKGRSLPTSGMEAVS
jgi:MFS family permease